MTPEKWQAAALTLAATLALTLPAALAMKRLEADGIAHLRVGVLLLVGYLLAIFFIDLSYADAPLLFGARNALLCLGASCLGVAVAKARE